jgi:hypothetical protein
VPTAYQGVAFLNHKTDGTFYADVHDLSAAAARIIQSVKSLPLPGFLLAGYQRFRADDIALGSMGTEDFTVSRLDSLVRLIKADPTVGSKVEVVTPQHFGALMRRNLGITSVVQGSSIPSAFTVSQNFPNPFNPSTEIVVGLPTSSMVSVRVFDLLGRQVAVLHDALLEPGLHRVRWNASSFSSGTYFCRVTAGSVVETRRMLLLR